IDAALEQAKASLALLLNSKGYTHARVDLRLAWVDSSHVAVKLEASPGAVCYFGEVIVHGANQDVIPLIKKTVSARPGMRFEPPILADSQNNMRLLNLFKRIRLDVLDAAADTLDLVVEVLMKEPRRIETALRYWTDEQLDGSVLWTHRNLFRRGRGGSVLASASAFRQKLEFSAWWPAILLKRSWATSSVGIENEIEDSYELTSFGGSIGLIYNFSIQSKFRVAVVFSDIDITKKTPDADEIMSQDGTLNSLLVRWERNAANDPVVPTRGWHTFVDLEWAPDAFTNDYHFALISPTGIAYVPLSRSHRYVWATRVTLGFAGPLGQSVDLLPNKRFYSGGATSMRGFNRRELGPRDSNGAPLGGEAKVEGSMELRFPLFWKFRGTWFMDTGQVWPAMEDILLDELEVASGLGLWIDTLIGPLRGNLAYCLTYSDNVQPRWVFHFSIGPSF
ncbi:MAG: outer membrane protein assembly factor, partial [Candidatus Latescibacterota bacterium]